MLLAIKSMNNYSKMKGSDFHFTRALDGTIVSINKDITSDLW